MFPCSSLVGTDGQLESTVPIGPSIERIPDVTLPWWNVAEALAYMVGLALSVIALIP